MDYTIIDKSIIGSQSDLEHLYVFKIFSVFMGCVDQSKEKDILENINSKVVFW